MIRPANSGKRTVPHWSDGFRDVKRPTTAVTARADPTERSIPPVKMTNVIPTAKTMLMDAWRRIFTRLLVVKKVVVVKENRTAITIKMGRIPRSRINFRALVDPLRFCTVASMF
jgi:hypothetical protein